MKGKKVSARERPQRIRENPVFRRQIFKELLQHVESGKSLDCFYACSEKAIQEYLQSYPDEWRYEELDDSIRQAKTMWEDIGYRQSEGKCLGNSRAWFYNMAHRYKWSERQHIETEHKGEVSINIVNYGTPKPS